MEQQNKIRPMWTNLSTGISCCRLEMRLAPCLDLILSRKRFQMHTCINWETGEIKQSKWILTQVSLVAVMGGGYPSSEVMWPFGSEFNFDCGKVTTRLLIYQPASTSDHLTPSLLHSLHPVLHGSYVNVFITSLYIHQCCMGDSLECGGSAQQAVNLMPSDTRTVFLGFEVHFSCFSCYCQ